MRAGMERAQAVAARRQVDLHAARLARRQQELHGHVRRRHRAREAEAAGRQRPHGGRGREGELDVLLEVAVVVDVAGRAMRAARQLAQRAGAELGAAAVGAEQVPLHGQKPGAHAGEAALDRGALRDIQLARQGLGLDRQKIGRHGGQHAVGQRPAEAVAVGAAVDLGGERRRPLARAVGQLGRGQVEMGRARALGEGDGFEDALAHDLARLGRQPRAEQAAHQGERLPFEGVAHLRADGAAGRSIGSRSNTGPKRRNGPLVKTRAWRKWRPWIHS